MKSKPNYPLIKKLCTVATGSMLLFAACKPEDPDCYQSLIVLNYTQFKTRYEDTIRVRIDSNSSVLDTVIKFRDSIMNFPAMYVLDEDTAYAVLGREITMLPSPFNPAKNSIRYKFTTDTTADLFDTLTFYYTSTPHFINNSCGYTYYYNVDSVKTTNNMLDSSSIANPALTDKNKEANVIFYFKKP